jgi:hypothetical protein
MKATTTEALVRRINRKLAPVGRRLRKTREGARCFKDRGAYYIQDVRHDRVVAHRVDPEALGHELGVLMSAREVEAVRSARGDVAEYLSHKAAYRESMADRDKPWEWGGKKNASYGASLRRVVEYVKKLPDNDPTLRKLASCKSLFEFGFEAPKDRGGQSWTESEAIHCGPRGKVIEWADCGEWFASWAECAIEEANEVEAEEDY